MKNSCNWRPFYQDFQLEINSQILEFEISDSQKTEIISNSKIYYCESCQKLFANSSKLKQHKSKKICDQVYLIR